MAFVYWIRKEEHTDIEKEGYIGITKRSVPVRYREHVSDSKRKYTYLYNAINKYGDSLIVDTLVECDLEYAYWLEERLRPCGDIGWNKLSGGVYKVSDLSSAPKSEAHRRALSKAQTGKKSSPESRAKQSASRKLYYKNNPMPKKGPAPLESILKRERTRFLQFWEKEPLVWGKSDIWYDFFISGKGGSSVL